jgi:hypothetical protein
MLQGQGKPADFKQIKQGLEAALKAEKDGDEAEFLKGMEKAKADAAKFLSSSSKYKVSEKTTYQFLADRLADKPSYPEPLNGPRLAELEARVRAQCSSQTAWDGMASVTEVDTIALLDPDSIKSGLEVMLSDWGETAFAVDDTLVRHVGYFIKFFALCNTAYTNSVLERSRKYLPYVRQVFARSNLHEDIAFAVPFVESGFTTSALSVAGALGMFQFMPATARDYGLVVDGSGAGRDERLNWEKTAPAAALYLVKNRNVFGSSVLALGSYHHGSMKVMQVLLKVAERSKVRSFSPIFEHGELEPYSKEYIPQCLAAAYIYRFVKQAHAGRLPNMGTHYETIREAQPVAKLTARYNNLLANNKDLTNADRVYCYASTGGYAVITGLNACKLNAAKSVTSGGGNREAMGQSPEANEACKVASSEGQSAGGKPEDNAGAGKAATGQDKPCTCNLMYTFQKGNSLHELAGMFGVDLRSILDYPLNRRWKERYPLDPRPGDIVVIPRLPSTTTIVSSGQSTSGPAYSYYTTEGQTLREVSQVITDTFQSLPEEDTETAGLGGRNATPEAILYWNRNGLPKGVGIEDPLPAGIPLFIVSDFRKESPANTASVHKEEQQSGARNVADGRQKEITDRRAQVDWKGI